MKQDASLRRVVYVTSLFPCWSETFIVREIDALIAAGVDVRIVSLKPPSETLVHRDAAALLGRVRHPRSILAALSGLAGAAWRHPSATVHAFAAVIADGWRRPSVVLKSLAALLRGMEHLAWLRAFDPDFLHAHWATYPSTVAWALGRITGTPFGFTCHAHDIFVERQLLARKLADAALAVTISRYNVAWLRRHVDDAAASRLKVVHCGVDLGAMSAVDSAKHPAMILSVGRLSPIKGYDVMIDALALLRARSVDFGCRLVGDGPLGNALREQAHREGVADRIEFSGAQPQEVIRDWMREAAVFVMPSQVTAEGDRDGIPVALMEAMASGCAVISTRVSGIPELIDDDVNGLLVEPRNPVALADAMQHLLQDEPLRVRLSTQARARVGREFDAHKEASRLHAHMQEAVHAHG